MISRAGKYRDEKEYEITNEIIENIYNPIEFLIEDQEQVRINKNFNALIPDWLAQADPFTDGMIDMFYTQWCVHCLRQKHEIKRGRPYKLVINTIPDLLWTQPLPRSVLNGANFYSCSQYINKNNQVSCKLSVAGPREMNIFTYI